MIDSEYTYNIKKKIEILLKTLIEEYGLSEIISVSHRYRLDHNKAISSKFYTFFIDKKDAKGSFYQYGHTWVPETLDDWLKTNFHDFITSEEIYDRVCHTGYITQEDLRLLNEIYKNHPQSTA